MPSLRDYRDRIASVKSTRKITSAMKMVAASKLRRAQEQAEASQPYATSMAQMIARLSANTTKNASGPALLTGTGKDQTYLLVVVSADRGLCGGFNSNIIRAARTEIKRLQGEGKTVKLVTFGRKARDLLRREYASITLESYAGITSQKKFGFDDVKQVGEFVLAQFAAGQFDVCQLLFNEFRSILVQKPKVQQLIPFQSDARLAANENAATTVAVPYDFEPDEETILSEILPRNIGVQIYRAILDSAAGEQAARMTAMDSATRNAGDMIKALSLRYNRARQAYITKELIEIISGAEAL